MHRPITVNLELEDMPDTHTLTLKWIELLEQMIGIAWEIVIKNKHEKLNDELRFFAERYDV